MDDSARPAPPGEDLSALSPLHVGLPLRTLSGGKARLGGVLDAEEREELILGLLRHTLSVLRDWPPCERIHVVSPDPRILELLLEETGADPPGGSPWPVVCAHRQTEGGLNQAVASLMRTARESGAGSLLVLPGDLPNVTPAALDRFLMAADAAMAAASGGTLVAIVPAEARNGTNALLLRPVDVIAPAFGPGSFEAHLRAAAAADAAVQVVDDPDLGFDLDTPDDLDRLDPERSRHLIGLGQQAAAWLLR
jgi:2-phospho-L-lactate guanylyltransferase